MYRYTCIIKKIGRRRRRPLTIKKRRKKPELLYFVFVYFCTNKRTTCHRIAIAYLAFESRAIFCTTLPPASRPSLSLSRPPLEPPLDRMASAPDAQVHPVHYGDTISLYCDDGPGFVYTQVTR